MDPCLTTDAERDTAALLVAAIRGDNEGLTVVANNLADPARTAGQLAWLVALAIDHNPQAAVELATELQRHAGLE